jgi:AraC family transcriptional regulator
MNIETVWLKPIPCIMLFHTGPYEQIEQKFTELWSWIQANGVPGMRSIGIYFDNPDHVPPHQLRSAACVEVPDEWTPPARGLPGQLGEIDGGTYARVVHRGPYDQLAAVWEAMTKEIEGPMGKTIPENIPAFEIYVNDAETTEPDQLVTELYMPIQS